MTETEGYTRTAHAYGLNLIDGILVAQFRAECQADDTLEKRAVAIWDDCELAEAQAVALGL